MKYIGILYHKDSDVQDQYLSIAYGTDKSEIEKELLLRKTPKYLEKIIFWEIKKDISSKFVKDINDDKYSFNFETQFTWLDNLDYFLKNKVLKQEKYVNYSIKDIK